MAGASDAANGQVFNVGAIEPISLRDVAELLIEVAGSGQLPPAALSAGAQSHRHRLDLRRRSQDPARPEVAAAHRSARGSRRARSSFYRAHRDAVLGGARSQPRSDEPPTRHRAQRPVQRARAGRPGHARASSTPRSTRVLDQRLVPDGPRARRPSSSSSPPITGPDLQAVGVGSGTDALTIGLLRARRSARRRGARRRPTPACRRWRPSWPRARGRSSATSIPAPTPSIRAEIDRRCHARARSAVLVVHLYGQPAPMDAIVERRQRRAG